MFKKIQELNLREKMGKIKRLTRAILIKIKALLLGIKGFLLPIFRKIFHSLSHFLTHLPRFSVSPIHRFFNSHLPTFSLSHFSLGLDIGTSSIKVAKLVKTRRGVRLLNFWEKEIPREKKGEAGEETIARTITELLSQTRLTLSQKIISSLPASSFVIKRLSLPFKGSRRIRQVIRYELEPYLPFPLEEAIIDFYIVDDRLPDRSLILSFAINKRVVERHLRILDGAGIKPEVVNLDSTSLFNIYAPREDRETTALINLGASQTIINIMSEGRLLFTRSIIKAGDDITQALSRELGISFKEAEELKRKGLDETKTEVIKPVLDEIMKETEHTFSSFLAFYPDKRIERILLTGGSARLSGIEEYFQKNLNIETSLFNPFFKLPRSVAEALERKRPAKPFYSRLKEIFLPSLKEISHALDSATLDRAMPLFPPAMGVALLGVARTRITFNFIQEVKPLLKRLEEARPLLKPAALLLISLLLLGLLDFYIHLYFKNKRSANLKKEIRLVFKKTFPEVTDIVDPLVQMKNNLEKREEDLALSPREFSSLSILRELSSLTPEDLGITIEDLSIDWDETRIRGRTSVPDFSLVDCFKKALEGSDYFTEVKVSDAHLSREGKSVEFRMTIKYGEER